MKNPDRYVVKPQREGGGNNIYGADIVPFLGIFSDKVSIITKFILFCFYSRTNQG